MHRFYLDTNIFVYLTDTTKGDSALENRVKLLVRAGVVEILGSLELLGEFVPRFTQDPEGYGRILGLFWTVCDTRILSPWNELIRKEIEKGTRLSLREAYLDLDTVKSARTASYDPSTYAQWAQGVQKRKEEYVQTMTEAANEVETIAARKWSSREIRKGAGQIEISRELVADWGHAMFGRNPSRLGLPSDEAVWPDPSMLPCTSSYIAMTLAWRRKCHEARRRDRGSDYYDSMHYVLAGMGNTLVTADKGLQDAVSLIEWNPVRVLSLNEFERLVSRM